MCTVICPETIFASVISHVRELSFAPALGQSRRREEFLADFHVVARRTLAPAELAILRCHFITGSEVHSRKPAARRVARHLGKALAAAGLFPLRRYYTQRVCH